MFKNLISALLICRLEFRRPAIDLELVLMLWRSRPVIEIVLDRIQERKRRRAALHRRLDEVYPF